MSNGVFLDNVKVYTYLNGVQRELSSDVLDPNIRAFWGIRGIEPTDNLADIGDLRFTLNNANKLYYPDGTSGLTGWSKNIPVKVVCNFGNVPFVRFFGYIDIDQIDVGDVTAENRVSITANDWMLFATRTPILEPDVATDVTADQALDLILPYCPIQPDATSFQTGDYTFPVVFDSVTTKTKAYVEFAKLVNSEGGYLYLTKPPTSGETLVFENASNRDNSHAQAVTYTYTAGFKFLTQTNDYFKTHGGGNYLTHEITVSSPAAVNVTADIDAVEIDYGKNVINRIKYIANPKRIDTEPQVLYSLDAPIPIANGETISFRAGYTDPEGGRQINALVSSMIAPVAPGQPWPELKFYCAFTDAAFIDETGNHTITQNDVTRETDSYYDVGATRYRINQNIIGPWAIFGGYADYNLSIADSANWDFGSGAFTVGWYENLINPADGNNAIARDATSEVPPWIFGAPNAELMRVYISSDGGSWDIANGRSLGQITRSRWMHYEVSRDADGWFYTFVNGKLTDYWYSSKSIKNSTAALSVGKSQTSNYAFMGFDEFYVIKGDILHKKDFEPPETQMSITLPGDYELNSNENGTGTDYSATLAVTAEYGSEAVTYTLKNNSGHDGYITKLQARGFGVYSYNPIQGLVEDTNSQTDYGFEELTINQAYQQVLTPGAAWASDILSKQKDPHTRLKSVSFWANRNTTTMAWFLQGDVGWLIYVEVTDPEIAGYYYVQSVNFEIRPGGLIYVTWGLKEGLEPA